MRIMNYQFSDSEWKMIVRLFEKNKNKLGLILRDNLQNLINCLNQSKTIVSVDQAQVIISLFLACGTKDKERKIDVSSNSEELRNLTEEAGSAIDIEQIIEQLRLFINKMHEESKTRMSNVTKSRS